MLTGKVVPVVSLDGLDRADAPTSAADAWVHVFTTACGGHAIFSWVLGLLSSIHLGIDMRDRHLGGVHVHLVRAWPAALLPRLPAACSSVLSPGCSPGRRPPSARPQVHDGSSRAVSLIHLMKRAAEANFLKPLFRFSAEPHNRTVGAIPNEIKNKDLRRPCGLSRLFVAEWFPHLDSGLYIDADACAEACPHAPHLRRALTLKHMAEGDCMHHTTEDDCMHPHHYTEGDCLGDCMHP